MTSEGKFEIDSTFEAILTNSLKHAKLYCDRILWVACNLGLNQCDLTGHSAAGDHYSSCETKTHCN
jgi:hypothetical protein